MSYIHEILGNYWGYDSFRPCQEDIINSVVKELEGEKDDNDEGDDLDDIW